MMPVIRAGALLLSCAIISCTRTHGDSDRPVSMPDPSWLGWAGALDAGVDREWADSSATSSDAAMVLRPEIEGTGREVWIGELWTVQLYLLCDPPPEFRVGPPGRIDRVALTLEPNEAGVLGGRIQFGERMGRELPQAPDPYILSDANGITNDGPGGFWYCSTYAPVTGAEYPLHEVVRSSDGVVFSFSPNQYWDSWCASAKPKCVTGPCQHEPFCICENGECKADLRRRQSVELSQRGSILEGHYQDSGWGTPSDIRLHRVQ